MTATDLEQTIARETHSLSLDSLREVLDYIQFLKAKEDKRLKKQIPVTKNIQRELSTLETDSLFHLEEEFAHYKELYPHEASFSD